MGKTSTYGGRTLPKHHVKIDAYGTVDELNSNLGLLRDLVSDSEFKKELLNIQDRLFSIGSHLASESGKSQRLPILKASFITELENSIDAMEAALPEMKTFLLPGGHQTVSVCHICRSVCRRAERAVSHLSELEEINALVLPYMNRLSDYLFVLSRKIAKDSNTIEQPWIPNFD